MGRARLRIRRRVDAHAVVRQDVDLAQREGGAGNVARHALELGRLVGVGDLLVQVNIEVPQKLDDAEETLLRELAELEHTNVAPQRKGFFETVKEYFTEDSD